MIRLLRAALFITGIGCLGYWTAAYLDTTFYQIRENRQFDQAEHKDNRAESNGGDTPPAAPKPRTDLAVPTRIVGRVSVPRLNLSAIVEEGTDDGTLRRAVGHVPGTALPGMKGNVVIAGHRDSFFRALKDLSRGDEIDIETQDEVFRYSVNEMSVVDPGNTSTLQPTRDNVLTIVTCFPFRYIGPAPRRFIARAREIAVVSKNTRKLQTAPVVAR